MELPESQYIKKNLPEFHLEELATLAGDAHLQMPQLARIQRILRLKFRGFGDTFKSCEHNLDLYRFVHFTSLLIVWLHVD